jgi:hypothetical protein
MNREYNLSVLHTFGKIDFLSFKFFVGSAPQYFHKKVQAEAYILRILDGANNQAYNASSSNAIERSLIFRIR